MDNKPPELGLKVEPKPTPQKGDYQFRPLADNDKLVLAGAEGDPKQIELTRQLLQKPEFAPTGVLHIDDKDFYVGKVIRANGRDQAIMFVKDAASGKLLPRVFYKSVSDGGWRATPGATKDPEDGKIRFRKGEGLHYTQETKPHADITRYLDEANAVGHAVDYPGDPIKEYFLIDSDLPKPEWDTFSRELRMYNSGGALRQFQKYQPGDLDSEYIPSSTDFAEKFRAINCHTQALEGFVPDFTAEPTATKRVGHTLLGYVNMDSFAASLNGRPIEWTMAYDKHGRVWVDRITFTDVLVNSYGVSSELINSGALTNKPIEYKQLITKLKPERDYVDFDATYADITPLLDNLVPIQEFRQAKGIQRPSATEKAA
jgi:hypothetical protein